MKKDIDEKLRIKRQKTVTAAVNISAFALALIALCIGALNFEIMPIKLW